MLNQVVLVGRLVKEPTTENLENGMLTSVICLATPRSYKNENGEYETDFIDVRLFSNIAENTKNYCKKGDMVGIKGRIQTRTEEKIKEDGEIQKRKITEIIGEKVTFLATSKKEENNEENEE